MRKVAILCVMLLMTAFAFAQERVITGTVIGDDGKPMSDVSVLVKGTQTGTITNSEGHFKIEVKPGGRILVFSSVGAETKEIPIENQRVINVTLKRSAGQLQEVLINVPYGTIKKTSFTGSETTVSANTIAQRPVTSVTKALDGLIPGVMMTNGGGAPGTSASLLVRGIGSVNASITPLYVLNGVPYDGSISDINTEDIESVTVLKDASAAALYGSRAANGVVMITTKRGQRGLPVTQINVQQGFLTRAIPNYDRVGPQDYYELFWESYKNSFIAQGNTAVAAGVLASNILTSNNGLVYNSYDVPGNQLVNPVTGKLNPNAKLLWNESWDDAMFRTASRTNANFSVSGASDKANYYFSAGYLNEEGISLYSGYRRYNLRLNVDMNATKWLKTGLNVDGSLANYKSVPSGGTATTNPFYYTLMMGPIYPVYQHDLTTGALVIDPATGKPALDWGVPTQMGTRPYAGRSNDLGSLALDDRSSNELNANANTFAEIKFLRDFTFKTTMGLNFYSSNGTSYQNNQFGDAAPTPGLADGGRSTKSNRTQTSLTVNEVLSWNKNLDKHNISALAGHENYRLQSHYLAAYMSGFLFPGQTELDNGTTAFSTPTSSLDEHTIESYFAGVNYTYDQKYLISGSYRTDGSSRFAPDVRWGNFYSAGLGWRISQENFMKSITWINELKFKASYGEQGNESIGMLYPYKAYYYANGNGTYSAPTQPANPNILWEKNKTTNIGLEFTVLDRRISGSVEWYTRESDNMLFSVPLPPSTGYGSVWQNIGTMKNTGIEAQISATIVRSRNFDWKIDANAAHFKNKITKLPPNQVKTGIVSGTKKLMEGHSIYDFWLRDYAGVDASTGDALYYVDVLDANGKATGQKTVTNVYNNGTFYFHGSAIPKIYGGVTNTFTYKGVSLSVLFVYSYGGLFYDGTYASLMHRGNAGTAWSTDILQRWQKPGDVTTVPRLQNAIAGQDGASTRWLFDGSWLNLKTISFSYSVPTDIANKMSLNGLSFFINGDNLWLFDAHRGMDPQRSFTGTSDWSYAPSRTVSVGVNLKFR